MDVNPSGKRMKLKKKSDVAIEYENRLRASLIGKYMLLFFFEDGRPTVVPVTHSGLNGDVYERSQYKVRINMRQFQQVSRHIHYH